MMATFTALSRRLRSRPTKGSVLCSIVPFLRFFIENLLASIRLCGLRVSDEPFAP
jgi:hypothetical protein